MTLEDAGTSSLEVLRSDNGVQCWEGDHSAVVWLLFGPCVVVWVVGIPLLASLLMRHYQHHWICPECGTKSPLTQASCSCGAPVGQDGERMLYSIGVQRKFAFLYKGYEPQYYYWELIVLSRKMIFVIIDVLGETLGPIIQTVLALLTVVVALLLHIKCEPYQVGEIDTLERISLTSIGPIRRTLRDVIDWARDTKVDGERVIDKSWVRHNLARVYAKVQVV